MTKQVEVILRNGDVLLLVDVPMDAQNLKFNGKQVTYEFSQQGQAATVHAVDTGYGDTKGTVLGRYCTSAGKRGAGIIEFDVKDKWLDVIGTATDNHRPLFVNYKYPPTPKTTWAYDSNKNSLISLFETKLKPLFPQLKNQMGKTKEDIMPPFGSTDGITQELIEKWETHEKQVMPEAFAVVMFVKP